MCSKYCIGDIGRAGSTIFLTLKKSLKYHPKLNGKYSTQTEFYDHPILDFTIIYIFNFSYLKCARRLKTSTLMREVKQDSQIMIKLFLQIICSCFSDCREDPTNLHLHSKRTKNTLIKFLQ